MATKLKPGGMERIASGFSLLLTAALAFVLPLGAGFAVAWSLASTIHNKNFPWITGRALGIAGYLALTGLVALGIWMRHPWRFQMRVAHPETRLRAHAALGVATIALIFGHLVFLASDHYAGVGWVGAIVPGLSHYRRAAVGIGVGAFELLIVIAATARFAGRRGTKHWLAIHRLASVTFGLTWFHGVLAGTDTSALRVLYVTTGTLIAFLLGTRVLARRRTDPHREEAWPSELMSEDTDHQLAGAPR
jgi:DMSO/TMAO reductase YedYZ heme-binding membrane subunit